MVSAAKLRRSQENMFAARPYAEKMLEVLNSLASRVDQSIHPLLEERAEKKIYVVVVTADKGLCGAFNTNILRHSSLFLTDQAAAGKDGVVEVVGRKARDYFKHRRFSVDQNWVGLFSKVRYEDADKIAQYLIGAYTREECDAIYLIYNQFKNMISQKLTVERLLPIPRLEFSDPERGPDYLYEPTQQELFGTLLPKHVTFQLFRAFLESAAAEQAARMTAMESATNNARDLIDRLTLYSNRVRQAAITKEIIEVVSGAQAQS
jgi:F-type H+-transporting ATPase subunit gamma